MLQCKRDRMDDPRCVLVTAAGARLAASRGDRVVLLSRSENVLGLGRELDVPAMVGDVSRAEDLAPLVEPTAASAARIDGGRPLPA